ncbi:MAG TPA: DUF1015 family protein [Mycobacteriales bacterium]|nr:DUF1015 family protein [Mycobacteriales bacterium]
MADQRPGPSAFLHPIPRGWVAARASVGGPNYDEFVDDDQIVAALARRPDSVVALDHPQHTGPARRAGLDFLASLPLAARQLAAMQEAGAYAPVTDGLFAYQMREAGGHTVRALVGLVRSTEFSSSPDEPGRIIRNEEVFPAKIEERRRHIEALGYLISPVLLLPGRATPDAPNAQDAYDDLLNELFDALPAAPLVADTDERGVTHSLWPVDGVTDGTAGRIGRVLDGTSFLVADGNHRSLATQLAGSPWCLVVVASAGGLRIEPYHRLLRVPDLDADAVPDRLAAVGIDLTRVTEPGDDPAAGGNHLYLGDGVWYQMDWPALVSAATATATAAAGADVAGALPHSIVERHVFGAALHLDPSAGAIDYVGGWDRRGYLVGEVDAGRATAALLLRPVTIGEFTAVNAARQQMPRKSTWFMPKARAGLVLARTAAG